MRPTFTFLLRLLAAAALLAAACPPGTFACPMKVCGEETGWAQAGTLGGTPESPCCQPRSPVSGSKCCCQTDPAPLGTLSEGAKALAPPAAPLAAVWADLPVLPVAYPRASNFPAPRLSSPPGSSPQLFCSLRC